MSKRSTALIAALSLIAAGTVFSSQVQAGASASAASKNKTHSVQVANGGQTEITQFTSSSAPRRSHNHQ